MRVVVINQNAGFTVIYGIKMTMSVVVVHLAVLCPPVLL